MGDILIYIPHFLIDDEDLGNDGNDVDGDCDIGGGCD